MSRGVTLRPARDEDMDRLGALKLESSLAWGDHVEALAAHPEAGRVPHAHRPHILVAEMAGAVVGFITVLPAENPLQMELEDLFVAPSAWRRGVGTQLLVAAERRALAEGARRLHVVASRRARAFYEKSGFGLIGLVETDFEPAPEMLKDLTRP